MSCFVPQTEMGWVPRGIPDLIPSGTKSCSSGNSSPSPGCCESLPMGTDGKKALTEPALHPCHSMIHPIPSPLVIPALFLVMSGLPWSLQFKVSFGFLNISPAPWDPSASHLSQPFPLLCVSSCAGARAGAPSSAKLNF